jgi:hypothetical protein
MDKKQKTILIQCVGIALIILAIIIPATITDLEVEKTKQACIQARGDWATVLKQCTFKENK